MLFKNGNIFQCLDIKVTHKGDLYIQIYSSKFKNSVEQFL
jgi:hypothetical protein